MSKYLKYAGRLLVLFAIFLAILVALGFVFEPKDNTEEAGMRDVVANGALGEPAGSIDVLFAGDSICSTAFAPLTMYEEQGFTSYNTASKGQKIFNSASYVDAAMDVQNPKVLVIEADVLFYGKSPMEAAYGTLMDIFPLFLYHNRWTSLTLADFTSRPHYTHTEAFKGYTIVDERTPMNKPEPVEDDGLDAGRASDGAFLEDLPWDDDSDDSDTVPFIHSLFAKKMIADAQAQGARVVIVASPCSRNWYEGRCEAVEKLCEQTGADFLDMNTQMWQDRLGLDYSTDVRDKGEHLNAAGGMKVSAALAEWLSDNYDLPDHREDSSYDEWDEDLAEFQEKIDSLVYKPYKDPGVVDTERINPRGPNDEDV